MIVVGMKLLSAWSVGFDPTVAYVGFCTGILHHRIKRGAVDRI